MSVVKINALNIPPQAGEGAGEELIKRFTARLDSLADVAGFEGFELLKPTGETETRWFVYTRWADQSSYEGWRDGDGARNSHARPSANADGVDSEDGGDRPESGEKAEAVAERPVSMGATLLEFEVAVSAGPSGV